MTLLVDGTQEMEFPLSEHVRQAQMLADRVYANTIFAEDIYGELAPYAVQEAFPLDYYLQMEEAVKEVIDPVALLVVDMMITSGKASESSREKLLEGLQHRFYSELIPKSIGFAGQIIFDYGLSPEVAAVLPQVAALVYLLDAIADREEDPAMVAQLLMMLQQSALLPRLRSLPLPAGLTFDNVFGRMNLHPMSEEFLRQVALEDALLRPISLQQRGDFSDIAEVSSVKIDGSGYDITFWVGMYALHAAGILEEDPVEVMQDDLLDKARVIGAAITRIADDIGDEEHDAEHGVLNVMSAEHRTEFMAAFQEYCRMTKIEISADWDDMQILDYFVLEMRNTLDVFIDSRGDQLTRSQMIAIKLLMRSVIICFENFIGDAQQTAYGTELRAVSVSLEDLDFGAEV